MLAALLAAPLFKATIWCVHALKLHLLRLDAYTRAALLLTGAFGAYALGANNIANVMGVFVNANPFTSFTIAQEVGVTHVQQLFLLGALAIAVGVFTYSRRVMLTVGAELLPLSPVGAWVALLAHSVVLFVFASQGLEGFLREAGLPALPLVPVSSSQAIVGAVIGIGLLKGGRAVRWSVAGRIVLGWIATPVASCLICFVSLFFLQNVFDQKVYRDHAFVLSAPVLERLQSFGIEARPLGDLEGLTFTSVRAFRQALRARATLSSKEERTVLASAQIDRIYVDPAVYPELHRGSLTPPQIGAVTKLGEQRFEHLWQFSQALARQDAAWCPRLGDAQFNDKLETNLDLVARIFSAQETEDLPP